MDRRDGAPSGQKPGERGRASRRRPYINFSSGLGVGSSAAAVLQERLLARIGSRNLVADLGRARIGDRNRAGADNLVFREPLVETRKGLTLRALEAHAAVTLTIGPVRGLLRTSINRHVAAGPDDRGRNTERAHHVAVLAALGIYGAHITPIVAEGKTDAVAKFDVTLAIGHIVENEAACRRAQRIDLALAYFE